MTHFPILFSFFLEYVILPDDAERSIREFFTLAFRIHATDRLTARQGLRLAFCNDTRPQELQIPRQPELPEDPRVAREIEVRQEPLHINLLMDLGETNGDFEIFARSSFEDLKVPANIRNGLASANIRKPSSIQVCLCYEH